jgi:hypothetical protein
LQQRLGFDWPWLVTGATLSAMSEPASLKRVKNSSFGGCIRRPTGDLPKPTVPACAPRRRFAKGLSVHSGQAKGEDSLLATPSL